MAASNGNGSWWLGLDRRAFNATISRRERQRERQHAMAVRRFLRRHQVQRVPFVQQPGGGDCDVFIQR